MFAGDVLCVYFHLRIRHFTLSASTQLADHYRMQHLLNYLHRQLCMSVSEHVGTLRSGAAAQPPSPATLRSILRPSSRRLGLSHMYHTCAPASPLPDEAIERTCHRRHPSSFSDDTRCRGLRPKLPKSESGAVLGDEARRSTNFFLLITHHPDVPLPVG